MVSLPLRHAAASPSLKACKGVDMDQLPAHAAAASMPGYAQLSGSSSHRGNPYYPAVGRSDGPPSGTEQSHSFGSYGSHAPSDGVAHMHAPSLGPPGQRLRRGGKEGAPRRIWLSSSSCGLIVAFLVYALILGGSLASLSLLNLSRPLHVAQFLVTNALLGMAVWAHLATMLTNPGTIAKQPQEVPVQAIPWNQPQLINGQWVTSCGRCNCYKPERAHHCSTCGHCIRKMDHHCPWYAGGKRANALSLVNNCVGENNQRYFVQFCFYIFAASAAQLLCFVKRFHECDMSLIRCLAHPEDESSPFVVLCLLMEAAVFTLFTLIMTCDQVCTIMSATSTIDKLKAARGVYAGGPQKRTWSDRYDNLKEAFGCDFGWQWFVPLPPARKRKAFYQPSEAV